MFEIELSRLFGAFVFSSFLLLATADVIGGKGPNIIFILVDDVGWADFNYTTKQETSIPTPHIDSLARFINKYTE